MRSVEVKAYWERNAPSWIELSRAGYDVYRDGLNTPAFLKMLPEVNGLDGVDLGCGEGSNTRLLAKRGARMSAIDIAHSFTRAARAAEEEDPVGISYLTGDATALPFPAARFDFAVAFMSFMDLPNQEQALAEVHRVLTPTGFFQFSILHPCFVPPRRKTVRDERGEAYAVEVADYFWRTDGDVERWTFGAAPAHLKEQHGPFEVPRFHRTLGDWAAMTAACGFYIDAIGEPMATPEQARAYPDVADTRIAPIFLHLRLRKRC